MILDSTSGPVVFMNMMPMTDFTELVKLLTATVSLLTALVGLPKALKQGSKPKKKGHRR